MKENEDWVRTRKRGGNELQKVAPTIKESVVNQWAVKYFNEIPFGGVKPQEELPITVTKLKTKLERNTDAGVVILGRTKVLTKEGKLELLGKCKTFQKTFEKSTKYSDLIKYIKICEDKEDDPNIGADDCRLAWESVTNQALLLKEGWEKDYSTEIANKKSERGQAYELIEQIITQPEIAIKELGKVLDDVDIELHENLDLDIGLVHYLKKMSKEVLPLDLQMRVKLLLERAKDLLAKQGNLLLEEVQSEEQEHGVTFRRTLQELKGQICLGFGECTPPSGKGESDSFLFKDPNGEPMFIFKPLQGEMDQSDKGWEKGGAAPRELLGSVLNEKLRAFGLDCGICETSLACFSDPSLANGTNSKAETRFGALQTFAPNQGSIQSLLGLDVAEGKIVGTQKKERQELQALKERVNREDVQKVMIFDFITMNVDRNATNLLVREDENQSLRLIPIDCGNVLPNLQALKSNKGGIACEVSLPESEIELGKNALMQLPQCCEPIDAKLRQAIDKLDPKALTGDLAKAFEEMISSCPQMESGVKPEVFAMMELSVKILKRACGTDAKQPMNLADLGFLYMEHMDSLAEKYVNQNIKEEDLDHEIDVLIAQVLDDRLTSQQIKELGGASRLTAMGYNGDSLLVKNRKEALRLLQEDIDSVESINSYNKEGGDEKLRKLDPNFNFDAKPRPTAKDKSRFLERLILMSQYLEKGGDERLRRAFQGFTKNINQIIDLNDSQKFPKFHSKFLDKNFNPEDFIEKEQNLTIKLQTLDQLEKALNVINVDF